MIAKFWLAFGFDNRCGGPEWVNGVTVFVQWAIRVQVYQFLDKLFITKTPLTYDLDEIFFFNVGYVASLCMWRFKKDLSSSWGSCSDWKNNLLSIEIGFLRVIRASIAVRYSTRDLPFFTAKSRWSWSSAVMHLYRYIFCFLWSSESRCWSSENPSHSLLHFL